MDEVSREPGLGAGGRGDGLNAAGSLGDLVLAADGLIERRRRRGGKGRRQRKRKQGNIVTITEEDQRITE